MEGAAQGEGSGGVSEGEGFGGGVSEGEGFGGGVSEGEEFGGGVSEGEVFGGVSQGEGFGGVSQARTNWTRPPNPHPLTKPRSWPFSGTGMH